ncbi:acyl-CoA dehydrogenase [Corynebacterium hindlerae]|uniref:acyl-CoA dehydrogenase n=1 Tax=Corynebacterium hindlerae TaxID=699041 RepID=UPI0031B6B9A0
MPEQTLAPLVLDTAFATDVQSHASEVDRGDTPARYILEPLATAGHLARPELAHRAAVIRELARYDLSVGFTVWADLMALTYLEQSGTEYAERVAQALRSGQRPGITAMASAFKEFAGAGNIELVAQETAGGFRINGSLAWASNLYPDALLVTAVKDENGKNYIVALDADAPGVELGKPFGLLGLNATASASVKFDNAVVPHSQVLSADFEEFMSAVRPTFVLLQVAECLGVAEAAITAAQGRLFGVNQSLASDVAATAQRVGKLVARHDELIATGGTAVDLLELRLAAAEAAVDAAALEVRVAGGAGYARGSATSRRFREATFIPVQSPSEAQLRWELAQLKERSAA